MNLRSLACCSQGSICWRSWRDEYETESRDDNDDVSYGIRFSVVEFIPLASSSFMTIFQRKKKFSQVVHLDYKVHFKRTQKMHNNIFFSVWIPKLLYYRLYQVNTHAQVIHYIILHKLHIHGFVINSLSFSYSALRGSININLDEDENELESKVLFTPLLFCVSSPLCSFIIKLLCKNDAIARDDEVIRFPVW